MRLWVSQILKVPAAAAKTIAIGPSSDEAPGLQAGRYAIAVKLSRLIDSSRTSCCEHRSVCVHSA